MAALLPCQQNRAPGLYDEQLQRQQQEKALSKTAGLNAAPALFKLAAPLLAETASQRR